MATDVEIRGLACDWSCCEIRIDGDPFPYGFNSIDYKHSLKSQKLWVNGQAGPVDRTKGKADSEGSATMSYKRFVRLREALGGGGKTGTDYMERVFQATITFRPLDDPNIYIDELDRVRIEEVAYSGKDDGGPIMANLSLSIMGVIPAPPQ